MWFFNLKSLILSLALSLLNSCGQPLCVAGFGQCDAPVTTTTTSTAASDLTLKFDKPSITLNQTATLTISGGTPNYKVEFTNGIAGGSFNPAIGSFSSTTSYTYTGSNSGTFTLKVTDGANKTATAPITVNPAN